MDTHLSRKVSGRRKMIQKIIKQQRSLRRIDSKCDAVLLKNDRIIFNWPRAYR